MKLEGEDGPTGWEVIGLGVVEELDPVELTGFNGTGWDTRGLDKEILDNGLEGAGNGLGISEDKENKRIFHQITRHRKYTCKQRVDENKDTHGGLDYSQETDRVQTDIETCIC